ncbi:MAG: MBL fold metallo-hydrolase, partial [Solirubrobacteraceae bacterium]
MRITWLGHATVLLELDGVRLLTDPVLGRHVGPLVRVGGEPVAAPQLGRIDSVLLSHLHADHADLGSLRRLGAPVIAPNGAGEWLRGAGVEDVRELASGDSVTVGGFHVVATPALHDDRRQPFGTRADPMGFVVRGSLGVYFAGDTDLFDGMAELRGIVDVALLPVWGWGPSVGEGHLDPRRAAQAVAMIEPKLAIPIHWGTFALPWARGGDADRPAREFAELVAELAPSVSVRVLRPGESV